MYNVEIQVCGQIDPDWSDWMGGLQIVHLATKMTQLSGQLPDQPALYAVLSRLAALNLELVALRCSPCQPEFAPDEGELRNEEVQPCGNVSK